MKAAISLFNEQFKFANFHVVNQVHDEIVHLESFKGWDNAVSYARDIPDSMIYNKFGIKVYPK